MKVLSVDKSQAYEEYKKEALLLKELRHPGIPMIYDLEEANGKLYIIEEYKKGITLYERVENIGTMSFKELINFGISLCQPIKYLHNQKYPIFHLDIQPRNLIIHNNTVSLIDFDHAGREGESGLLADGYGTPGYAAPEQYRKKRADARTDLYAIAAVLYYAGNGVYPRKESLQLPKRWGKDFSALIESCLKSEKEGRPQSVEAFLSVLEGLALETAPGEADLRIASVSAEKNCGNTYIALGLCAYLRRRAFAAIYEENNESGHMSRLASALGLEYDRFGYFRFHKIPVRPSYPDYIELEKLSASICVEDYGTNLKKAIGEKPDLLLFICKDSVFKREYYLHALQKIDTKQNYLILSNLAQEEMSLKIPPQIDPKRCLSFPYIKDIWKGSEQGDEIYQRIAKAAGIRWEEKGFIEKLKSRIRKSR